MNDRKGMQRPSSLSGSSWTQSIRVLRAEWSQRRGSGHLWDAVAHCPVLLQVLASHILVQCPSASPGVAQADTGVAWTFLESERGAL
jgi:hypothetical protein